MIKVLFTGSREWRDVDTVRRALNEYDPREVVIVEGGHRPAPHRYSPLTWDRSLDAITWTLATGYGFDVITYWAPWNRLDKVAGPYRNRKMFGLGIDRVEAFPLPDSRGTIDAMDVAKLMNIPVQVWKVGDGYRPEPQKLGT